MLSCELLRSIDLLRPLDCMSNCATLFGLHLLSLLLAEHLSVITCVPELSLLPVEGHRSDHLNAVRVHRSINLHLVHIDVFHILGYFAQFANFLGLVLSDIATVVAYFWS